MGNSGHEEYFNRVYNETCKSVSRFVVSKCGNMDDAEDIIQNVYTRFFKRISEKGHEDIESPEAFLINIAKFECRTYFSGSTVTHGSGFDVTVPVPTSAAHAVSDNTAVSAAANRTSLFIFFS